MGIFCHGVARILLWVSHSNFWEFPSIFQALLSRSTLFLLQKLGKADANFGQRWWSQKWNKDTGGFGRHWSQWVKRVCRLTRYVTFPFTPRERAVDLSSYIHTYIVAVSRRSNSTYWDLVRYHSSCKNVVIRPRTGQVYLHMTGKWADRKGHRQANTDTSMWVYDSGT